MAGADELLVTIEAVHAAGLDAALWPQALDKAAQLVGGIAATLEVFDRDTRGHRDFLAHGLPPAHELSYLDQYSRINPRAPKIATLKAGGLVADYSVLDENGMDHHAFYAEFLAPVGFRYFIAGVLQSDTEQFATFGVQRTRTQGHVERADIDVMQRLLPHVRQAYDVTRRLRATSAAQRALQAALDWLGDAVVLIDAAGRMRHANAAARLLLSRGDGLRCRNGALEFIDPNARAAFDAAIARGRRTPLEGGVDFLVRRNGGRPPYLVALRPIASAARESLRVDGEAVAIVFVHDPLRRNAATQRMLQQAFGLTETEADLAQALQAGTPLTDYARSRGVSLNTIYTHLRRIKDKTGCHRMAELIRTLNDLHLPLRAD